MLRAALLLASLLLFVACSSEPPPPEEGWVEEPVAEEPAPFVPYTGECPKIALALGVPKLTLELDADEVARQEALGGQVEFETAFRRALESLLTDGEHPESPLALLRGDEGISQGGAEARTRGTLDQASSYFGLVPLVPPNSEQDPNYGLHRPPGGEDPRQFWIFYLLTKETADHAHWAVVPRNGDRAFNYGFN